MTVTAFRFPVPVEGWPLLVRSTDSDGDPVPVATSIILPVAPYLAGGERPLLSYQVGLDADSSSIGLVGYSGGGQATTWAAELQGSYAPELNIVGVAGGGVPVDLNQVARHLDGALEAGIAIAAGFGIDREFPAMDLAGILNQRGREVRDEVSDQCIEDFAASYPGVSFADLSHVDDPLSLPQVSNTLEANSLAKDPPIAPFYLWHSVADQLIPVSGADALAAYYCTEGDAPFFHDRNAAGEHIAYAIAGAPGAFAFLAERFAGLPAPDSCDAVPVLTGTVVAAAAPDRLRTRPHAQQG